jgi:hypothetical protein
MATDKLTQEARELWPEFERNAPLRWETDDDYAENFARFGGRMTFQFYGYNLRTTESTDLCIARLWSPSALGAAFWLKQDKPRCQSFLVSRAAPKHSDTMIHTRYMAIEFSEHIAFFQSEYVKPDQVRLHVLECPYISPRKFLRALTTLVPLIEKALALDGVKTIFFTVQSPSMVSFIGKRLGYKTGMEYGTDDGQVMWKHLVPIKGNPVVVTIQ